MLVDVAVLGPPQPPLPIAVSACSVTGCSPLALAGPVAWPYPTVRTQAARAVLANVDTFRLTTATESVSATALSEQVMLFPRFFLLLTSCLDA